jgi:hypothetical protein
MAARGLGGTVAESGDIELAINSIQMRNHRTNAYTPFITLTLLSAELTTPMGRQRLGVFIKRGKVPVWTFSEVVEPIFTQPMSLLVKELVAKINRIYYGNVLPDSEVARIVAKIESGPVDRSTLLDVYELGFSNNPAAVLPLVLLTNHDAEYVRLAAISSLGNLGAESEVEVLQAIHESADSWQDRAMALKALGDIGTEEAIRYLRKAQRTVMQDETQREALWTREVIDLYLLD